MPNLRAPSTRVALLVAVLGLLLVPGLAAPVLGHGGHDHGSGGTGGADEPVDEPDGNASDEPVNLTASPWLDAHRGYVFFGNVTNLTIPAGMRPHTLRGTTGWLAWLVDHPTARDGANVYVYDPASMQGFFVTNDTVERRDLAVAGDHVAWTQLVGGRFQIVVHRISQAVTWTAVTEMREPRDLAIGSGILAFTRMSVRESQIIAVDLLSREVFPVTEGAGQRDHPVIAGDLLAYRDLSYGLQDVGYMRVSTRDRGYLTRDVNDERRLTSDGRDLFWTVQGGASPLGAVWHFDASVEEARKTPVGLRSLVDLFASDGLLALRVRGKNDMSSIEVASPRHGAATEVVPNLPLLEAPVFVDRVLYLLVKIGGTYELLAVRPSDLVELPRPDVVVQFPLDSRFRFDPFRIAGVVDVPEGHPGLTTVRYRAGEEFEWKTVANVSWEMPGRRLRWEFVVDPRDFAHGRYIFQVQALFEGAPGASAFTTQLFGPQPAAARSFTFDRLRSQEAPSWLEIALNNPGTLLTVLFVVLLVALVVVRVVLRFRQRPGVVEYVRQEGDDAEDPLTGGYQRAASSQGGPR